MRTEQEIQTKIKGIRSWDYLLGDMPGNVALELMARSLEWALKEPDSLSGATWYCLVHRCLDCELCPKGKCMEAVTLPLSCGATTSEPGLPTAISVGKRPERRRVGTFIGRAKGKKDTKSHLYSDELGFPLRLCDWLRTEDDVEKVAGITCRHCLKIRQGRRQAALGGWYEDRAGNPGHFLKLCRQEEG